MNDDMIRPDRRGYPPWLTPVFGGLAGLSLVSYTKFFGGGATAGQIAMWIVLGTAAFKLLSFMDATESVDDDEVVPNATLTGVLLLASLLFFWVPIVGLALISYALYRSRWLEVNEWVLFPFSCLFFVSAAITLVSGIILVIDE